MAQVRPLLALAALAILSSCGDETSFSGSSTKSAGDDGRASKPTANSSSADAAPQGGTPSPNSSDSSGDDSEFDTRLDREKAKSGDIQISLKWNGRNDLDLHVITPAGRHISYAAPNGESGGMLDVDMNAGGQTSDKPIENVFWPAHHAPHGRYKIYVHHFTSMDGNYVTPFEVRLKVDGKDTFYRNKATFDGSFSGEAVGYVGDDAPATDDASFYPLPPNAVLVHEFTY